MIYIYLIDISKCKQVYISCLAGGVLTHSPLTAVTQVRYPASACEMVMWSPSQTGGFPPGISFPPTPRPPERKHD